MLTDASFFRELRLRPVARADVANVSVFQPMLALPTLQRLQIPVLMGNNAHEGTLFVFTAYPARMTKLVFSALVLSMFRTSALAVLRIYDSLIRVVDDQRNPDYRLVLSQILGDYLFACPNHKVAVSLARLRGGDRPSNESQTTTAATSSRYSNRLHQKVSRSPKVFLYDFRLPTRTPGFAFCTGLSCHTSELPYVFDQQDIVANYYSYPALAMGRETRLDAHEQQVLEAHGEVARRMSDHWVTFARFGDVNGQQQQSGDYSYIPGTGVRGVGQWPEVLGQALPSDRPVCALARAPSAAMSAAGDALEGSTSSKLVSTPLDAALSEIEVEDHEEEAFEEAVRINKLVLLHSQLLDNEMGDEDLSSLSAMDRSVRRMVFAESSHVVEEDRDRDCLCLFWDKLAYRF